MSIMQCDRKGCEHTMCDRYSEEFGYLCDDCFEELTSKIVHPKEFMNKEKDSTDKALLVGHVAAMNEIFKKGNPW